MVLRAPCASTRVGLHPGLRRPRAADSQQLCTLRALRRRLKQKRLIDEMMAKHGLKSASKVGRSAGACCWCRAPCRRLL